MFKGIDIRYATRPTANDLALMELRDQLRTEEERHQSLRFKLNFLGTRLQAALDAGRTDNALEAANMFSRLKEDLALRFKTIIALNREIATLDPKAEPQPLAPALQDPAHDDALMDRVLAQINTITQPNALPC